MKKHEKEKFFIDRLNEFQLLLMSDRWTLSNLGEARRELIRVALLNYETEEKKKELFHED